MDLKIRKNNPRKWRKIRIRKKLAGTAQRPRLAVFRSDRHIYVQAIDDINGHTLAAASTVEKDFKGNGATVESAGKVGKAIADRLKKAGIEKAVFDRGGNLYHGRIKAVAEGARENGLTI